MNPCIRVHNLLLDVAFGFVKAVGIKNFVSRTRYFHFNGIHGGYQVIRSRLEPCEYLSGIIYDYKYGNMCAVRITDSSIKCASGPKPRLRNSIKNSDLLDVSYSWKG